MPGEPEWIGQLEHLGQQIIVALAKMAALLVFIFAHWGLDAALRITIRGDFKLTHKLIEIIVTIAFLLLYVDQLVEMLAVFIPRLGTLHGRFVRGDTHKGS